MPSLPEETSSAPLGLWQVVDWVLEDVVLQWCAWKVWVSADWDALRVRVEYTQEATGLHSERWPAGLQRCAAVSNCVRVTATCIELEDLFCAAPVRQRVVRQRAGADAHRLMAVVANQWALLHAEIELTVELSGAELASAECRRRWCWPRLLEADGMDGRARTQLRRIAQALGERRAPQIWRQFHVHFAAPATGLWDVLWARTERAMMPVLGWNGRPVLFAHALLQTLRRLLASDPPIAWVIDVRCGDSGNQFTGMSAALDAVHDSPTAMHALLLAVETDSECGPRLASGLCAVYDRLMQPDAVESVNAVVCTAVHRRERTREARARLHAVQTAADRLLQTLQQAVHEWPWTLPRLPCLQYFPSPPRCRPPPRDAAITAVADRSSACAAPYRERMAQLQPRWECDVFGACADIEVPQLVEMTASTLPSALSREVLQRARVIGQFHRKFVVVHTSPGLYLLDQHAADERVRYEALQQQWRTESRQERCASWRLHQPFRVSLGLRVVTASQLRQVYRLGWRVHFLNDPHTPDAASPTWLVTAVPLLLGDTPLVEARDLLDYLDALQEHGLEVAVPAAERHLASRACRYAIMFGDALDAHQCRQLVQRLAACAMPFQCAHGRPSMARIAQHDPPPAS
ncbi:hypothetical protein CDCA_CDCA06G1741 [Cyanidium caldarium]|uniref:MutL C-terminal dimerisation domain-containing protein n=1 Tax=Cyanidium caldarium TaxID=2771 RepID=A0AAV9IU73_CYACA|nr:hypothetical protein CDCA_CDCA06G1741 [Cyanidium caldarium]